MLFATLLPTTLLSFLAHYQFFVAHSLSSSLAHINALLPATTHTYALRERQINARRESFETVLLKTVRLICLSQTFRLMHHLALMILRVLEGCLPYVLSRSNFRTFLKEIISSVNQRSIVLPPVDKGHK